MDGLEFTASIVSALAWPVCVVAVVAMLRKALRRLLSRLVKVKFPGGNADFAAQAAGVDRAVEAAKSQATVTTISGASVHVGGEVKSLGPEERRVRVLQGKANGAFVDRVLNWLSPADRELISQYYYYQHSFADIARMYGVPEMTVMKKIAEIQDKLKRLEEIEAAKQAPPPARAAASGETSQPTG